MVWRIDQNEIRLAVYPAAATRQLVFLTLLDRQLIINLRQPSIFNKNSSINIFKYVAQVIIY